MSILSVGQRVSESVKSGSERIRERSVQFHTRANTHAHLAASSWLTGFQASPNLLTLSAPSCSCIRRVRAAMTHSSAGFQCRCSEERMSTHLRARVQGGGVSGGLSEVEGV
jgi:hypothetical protein